MALKWLQELRTGGQIWQEDVPVTLITQEIPRVGNYEIRTVDIDQICKKCILIIQTKYIFLTNHSIACRHNKILKIECLNKKLLFPQFWRLKVQDQYVVRVGFSWGPWCLTWPFLCACTSLCLYILISFYRGTSQMRLGLTLMVSF